MVRTETDEEPDFEIVDEKPKKRVAAFVDDDETDRPRKRRARDEDDEDDEPKTKRKRDDEDDEPKAKKRRRRDDDEDDDDDDDTLRGKKKRRRDDDDDEDEDDEDDRPRKKKKKKRSGIGAVLAFAGIGLALLLLVGGLLWFFWPNGVGANVRYLPDNSQIVASIKVEELLSSKAYKQIKDEFPKVEKDLETEKEFGLALSDISSVLVGGGKTGAKPDFVMVVQTTKSVKADDLLAKIKDNKFTKETVGDYVMYTRGTNAFCVAESKVVLISEPDALRKVLKRDGKPNFSDGMKAAIKEADFSKTIAVAVNVKEIVALGGKGGNGVGLPIDRAADEYAKNVEGFGGWVSVNTDINGKFTAIFKDDKAAADGKKLLDGLSVMAKNAKVVPTEAVDFLEHLEFKLSGNRVELAWAVEVSKILKLAKSTGSKF
ncbi:hypothetical protein [Frigoriglobus tundricola]|uniref:hypothetical protein n=1 Tax=Frigoriglobus tundricola TaxID=2774151 RepID=UPI00148EA77C|nr:hypothetical protein [Frigoriglobus tundricola]